MDPLLALNLVNGAGVLLGLSGSFINISPEYSWKQAAFMLWIFSDVALAACAIATGNMPLALMYAVYEFLAIAGYLKNRQKIEKLRGAGD